MYNFCTLFDKNYLHKGITLYNSLFRNCLEFNLWVLCMDDTTFNVMADFKSANLKLIKMSDFEDDELLQVKKTRSAMEYCWTLTPSLPLYVLKNNPEIEVISYLDADLYFYSDPKPVFDEFGDKSIMIIEHRFPPGLKYLEINGIYNVQMMTFRNDMNGMKCLKWWRERCNEWCYYEAKNGKLGDQKYLDDWITRFDGVHVLQHKGAGLAIWNIERYNITQKNNTIFVDDDRLIFYHFHGFHLFENGMKLGTNILYTLTNTEKEIIYQPYITELKRVLDNFNLVSMRMDIKQQILESIFQTIAPYKSKREYLIGLYKNLGNVRKIIGRNDNK